MDNFSIYVPCLGELTEERKAIADIVLEKKVRNKGLFYHAGYTHPRYSKTETHRWYYIETFLTKEEIEGFSILSFGLLKPYIERAVGGVHGFKIAKVSYGTVGDDFIRKAPSEKKEETKVGLLQWGSLAHQKKWEDMPIPPCDRDGVAGYWKRLDDTLVCGGVKDIMSAGENLWKR